MISWVVGDRIGAESIAEGLVKANRASLMGLEPSRGGRGRRSC